MYLTLIFLPLIGSIISGFFGRKIGVTGAQLITCSCIFITTILSITVFLEVGMNNIPVTIKLFNWIDSEYLNIFWSFNFDSLTASMLLPVLIISCLVHIYSIGYMSHDPHNQRFFSYLSLFTFMMIILVTANNFLLMFVGWEGVGVCSYLLVSFWYTRIAANQSSLAAFFTNRVGDCLLTVGLFIILWTFGNIDYSTVFSLAPYINENIITIIGVCLLIGAMAKSSQVGLHVWLPMAMEGPTPVSALIHAATMVTAGVYLLMRTSPLIEYSSTLLLSCLWLGAITTVFSSLIGLFQQDIKKVIAYSTMSQLGMMVIAVGLSSYNIALFHLVNHAFYKGLLFLGAGAVIHAVADNQDFRKYGGLVKYLPLSYSVMLIASLSLVAFPFMTGFYSKDFILESAYGQFCFSSVAVYFIATVGAMFTTLYSVKVLYLTFLGNPNGTIINYKGNIHEGNLFMSLPLIILAVFSIFFGYITKDIFIGIGSGFFADNGLFIHPLNENFINTEFAVPTIFKLLPLMLTISLTIISIFILEFSSKLLIYFKYTRIGYSIFSFFNLRFLIELYYNKYITNYILNIGGKTTKLIDKGSVELIGPFGLEKSLTNLSYKISKLDTYVITSYALYILIGFLFFITIPFIKDKDLVFIIIFNIFNIFRIINYQNERIYYAYNLPPVSHKFVKVSLQSSVNPGKQKVIYNENNNSSSSSLGSTSDESVESRDLNDPNRPQHVSSWARPDWLIRVRIPTEPERLNEWLPLKRRIIETTNEDVLLLYLREYRYRQLNPTGGTSLTREEGDRLQRSYDAINALNRFYSPDTMVNSRENPMHEVVARNYAITSLRELHLIGKPYNPEFVPEIDGRGLNRNSLYAWGVLNDRGELLDRNGEPFFISASNVVRENLSNSSSSSSNNRPVTNAVNEHLSNSGNPFSNNNASSSSNNNASSSNSNNASSSSSNNTSSTNDVSGSSNTTNNSNMSSNTRDMSTDSFSTNNIYKPICTNQEGEFAFKNGNHIGNFISNFQFIGEFIEGLNHKWVFFMSDLQSLFPIILVLLSVLYYSTIFWFRFLESLNNGLDIIVLMHFDLYKCIIIKHKKLIIFFLVILMLIAYILWIMFFPL